MMNVTQLFRAVDAAVALGDVVRRFKGNAETEPHTEPERGLRSAPAGPPLTGHLEARLTGVVVAALKEAFDRDHARLELERTQIEEQRRRAEDALRAEMRRQASERELQRLRLLAGTALVGWIAAVVLFVARLDSASLTSRGISAASWLLLLGALGAAFTAQGRVTAQSAEVQQNSGGAALWLLLAGLALAAIAMLF